MKDIFIIAAVSAAALASSAWPASADPPRRGAWQMGHSTYHLYLTDLDLDDPLGRAEALRRLESVAARLCRFQGVQARRQSCVAATIKTTVGSAAGAIQLATQERAVPRAPATN